MKHITQHTCGSAIYHNRLDLVSEFCTEEFLEGFRPKSQIIEMMNFIMLMAMPTLWMLYCNKALDIPAKLDDSPLAMIKRKDLCNCSFSAGPYYVHENIISCEDQERKSISGIGICDAARVWGEPRAVKHTKSPPNKETGLPIN